jgi:hypothetical protein
VDFFSTLGYNLREYLFTPGKIPLFGLRGLPPAQLQGCAERGTAATKMKKRRWNTNNELNPIGTTKTNEKQRGSRGSKED